MIQGLLQETLEQEMAEALTAGRGERTAERIGYRSGHYPRSLVTRVGKLELRVPRDRDGRFSTELFKRCQRSEQALVGALAEMYIQGVSTRKVKAITEELCGHSVSASSISSIDKRLDGMPTAFAERELDEPMPHVILDARYGKVRENGVIRSQAVLIAIGIGWDAAAISSASVSPAAKVEAVGRRSPPVSASVACTASSSWPATTTTGS